MPIAQGSSAARREIARDQGLIQGRIVILIALLALAGLTVALGATYWLIRERDNRSEGGAG